MGFIVEDRHLRVSKSHGATSLYKMYPRNGQTTEYWRNETFKPK